MRSFVKSPLSASIALAMSLAAGGLVAPGAAVASNISADGLGQALIFPYYSVRDGYRSLFNVTNTSGETIAVKVRFRESWNSRDVLDFNLVMSPQDTWTGFLADTDNGPVLTSGDSTCTVPYQLADGTTIANGFALSNGSYTGSFADDDSDSIDRTREGYVEMIVMGRTNANPSSAPGDANHNPIAYYAKHDNQGTDGDPDGELVPRNCTTVSNLFAASNATAVESIQTSTAGSAAVVAQLEANPSGSPEAAIWFDEPMQAGFRPLKGNFSLISSNSSNETAGGIAAIAIESWTRTATGTASDASGSSRANDVATNANNLRYARTPYDASGDGNARNSNDVYVPNLITAQEYPYFLEPTLASAWGLWSVDELVNPLVDPTANNPSSTSILKALQLNNLVNEWATSPGDTGAQIDWVVSMPLKNFFVDAPRTALNADVSVQNNLQAAINTTRGYQNVTTSGSLAGITSNVNMAFAGTYNVPAISADLLSGSLSGYDAAADTLTHPATADLSNMVTAFSNAFNDGRSRVNLDFLLVDREEETSSITADGGPTLSPNLPQAGEANTLDFEVNVISFDNIKPLSSQVTSNINVPDSSATFGRRGWMRAELGDVPAVGFMWKFRNAGSTALNYTQMVAHGTNASTGDHFD